MMRQVSRPVRRGAGGKGRKDLARSLPSGDPQECADRIRQLYETVGGFGMLLAITQDSDNPAWDHRSLQLLSEEVGPRIADLGHG